MYRVHRENGASLLLLTSRIQVQTVLAGLPKADLDPIGHDLVNHRLFKQNITMNTVSIEGNWCVVDSENNFQVYGALVSGAKLSDHFWTHDWRW